MEKARIFAPFLLHVVNQIQNVFFGGVPGADEPDFIRVFVPDVKEVLL